MMKILAVTLAVTLLAQEGFALKCYKCASSSDSATCGDQYKGNSKDTCTLDVDGICFALKVKSPIGSLRATTRDCLAVPNNSINYCESIKSAGNILVEECSTCTTDYCNGSPRSVAVSLSALLLVIGVALKHVFFP